MVTDQQTVDREDDMGRDYSDGFDRVVMEAHPVPDSKQLNALVATCMGLVYTVGVHSIPDYVIGAYSFNVKLIVTRGQSFGVEGTFVQDMLGDMITIDVENPWGVGKERLRQEIKTTIVHEVTHAARRLQGVDYDLEAFGIQNRTQHDPTARTFFSDVYPRIQSEIDAHITTAVLMGKGKTNTDSAREFLARNGVKEFILRKWSSDHKLRREVLLRLNREGIKVKRW